MTEFDRPEISGSKNNNTARPPINAMGRTATTADSIYIQRTTRRYF